MEILKVNELSFIVNLSLIQVNKVLKVVSQLHCCAQLGCAVQLVATKAHNSTHKIWQSRDSEHGVK